MKKNLRPLVVAFVSLAILIACKKDRDESPDSQAMSPEEIKTEIIRLENLHVKAILQKDSVTLVQVMASALLVNNPRNTVTVGSAGVISRLMSGELDHTGYFFEMEQILIKENTVITMGNETVIPANGPDAGKTVKRRYSQVWVKEEAGWKMHGRHANVLKP